MEKELGMNAADLCYTSATRLAAMIRAGAQISPVELTRDRARAHRARESQRSTPSARSPAEHGAGRARRAEADGDEGRARWPPLLRASVLHQGSRDRPRA